MSKLRNKSFIDCVDDEFGTPMSKKWDLERDLKNSEFVKRKIDNNPIYRQHLYAALCNNSFQPLHIWPQMGDYAWSCSWRYAGEVVAEILGEGNYIDYYCSFGDDDNDTVHEGTVTDEVVEDLRKLGWVVVNK